MARRRKVWIIVTQDGDIGEGPWSDREEAERYMHNEVGVLAGVLQVYEDSVGDLRRVRDLSFTIQDEPEKFKAHL